MSKRLITTFDASGRPVTQETWNHIEQGYQEQIEDICIKLIKEAHDSYSSTAIYIIYGCEISNDGINWTINKGCIFYNGFTYRLDAAIVPYVTGTLVANLSQTYYGGAIPDPIQYDDLSYHSPHQINKVILVDGVSGSGTFNGGTSAINDYNNFILSQWEYSSTGIVAGTPSGYTILIAIGGSFYNLEYKRIGKEIFLRGRVGIGNTGASGGLVTLFTLPVGARPSKTVGINPAIDGMNYSLLDANSSITIDSAGVCSFSSASGAASCSLYFDCIKFSL